LAVALATCAISATPAGAQWNNPYPASDAGKNILYAAFDERPKHLDPARSYASNEWAFIAQIYEPPFQYHYLKRPYTLIPLTATEVPRPKLYDNAGRRLPDSAAPEAVAKSVYEIHLRPGIQYAPHPCFARDEAGRYRYHALTPAQIGRVRTLADFEETGTRELIADDYVYQIKRLAHPKLHSPIFSIMADYIVGLRDFSARLQQDLKRDPNAFLDLSTYPLAGAEAVDRYTYRVTINGKYPQLLYWMAMMFFSPMPAEADRFFSQPGMAERNLTLDWYAVGTGAYMLAENNPNRRMVLERNPNYHDERYPSEGEPGDAEAGLLADAGKPLPFIDKAVFSLEKESIPYWNKFLQGYYDQSGVSEDSFDQAVRIAATGEAYSSGAMEEKGIRLLTSVQTSTFYFGFNMLDPVVGGYSERARKLRQAISIAFDVEEFVSIFLNGRGVPAQGPIPPEIFGHEEGCAGINSYVFDCVNGNPRRKPLSEAKRLLAEAGYPGGRDPKTGEPLLIYYDTADTGPEDKAKLDWTRKQFSQLGIQLVPRQSDYNRFQDKMRTGDAQFFRWGWHADYPDPENFMFLLYGPNKKVGNDGENAANYDSPEFNRLFERMKNMDNGPARMKIIREMNAILTRDAPWLFGFHPKKFVLVHAWLANTKPHQIANNTLKYQRLDPARRDAMRAAWNKPVVWPIVAGFLAVGAISMPAILAWRRRERASAR
jgi:ABC-type transport system substrate-binding protein